MKATLPLLSLLVLVACGGGYPGGGNGGGSGGGGSGGDRGEPLYEVAIPGGIDVEVRSQLFAVDYLEDGLLPSAYTVYLLDEGRACSESSGLRLDDGESWLSISIVNPAPGECPVFFPEYGWDEEPVPPPGCYARVAAGRQAFAATDARDGAVRIDRLEAGVLAGELHVRVPSLPVRTGACWASWGDSEFLGGGCDCYGPDGEFECETTDPVDSNCCDDALALVEVSFPFEASRCDAAGLCDARPCAPELAAACDEVPPPPPSCEAACDAYAATCTSCLGCPGTTCEDLGLCDRADCLARCRGLASADPLVALSLSCVASAASCGDWASCVSACGAL